MRRSVIGAIALIAALSLLPVSRAIAGDDWQWWMYVPVSYKPGNEVKVDVTGLFRWKNDMKDFYYRGFLAGGYYTVLPWFDVGAHYWFKEIRPTVQSPWYETNTFLVRANFKYKLAEWWWVMEANRLEYDIKIDRWKLRIKPKAVFPLAWLGLSPISIFLDNEFFFAFDYPYDIDVYSENRATIGINAKVVGPFGASVAYRNVGRKSPATGDWNFTNVLATYVKLAF